MLSKKICKKCHNEKYLNGWNEDTNWEEKGLVHCPSSKWTQIFVDGGAPKDCYYRLEHLVLEQEYE